MLDVSKHHHTQQYEKKQTTAIGKSFNDQGLINGHFAQDNRYNNVYNQMKIPQQQKRCGVTAACKPAWLRMLAGVNML